MFIRSNSSWVRFSVLFFVLTIFASTAFAALDEDDPLFATRDLEKELCARFRLKPKEISALHPLIKLDNRNAALLYIIASDSHEADYMFLWEKVRRSHAEFEASINPALPKRQRAALKLAHAEFGIRILTLWTDDYVNILGEVLELDSVQMNVVRVVFDVERERRRRLMGRDGPLAGEAFDRDWDRLTSERDKELIKILSTDQLRAYRSLTEQPLPWIA